ncbi:MAG TPA: type II toxin-antitoxin system PemK/MazF family toxin, partial [Chloroflexota bacterium]
MNRGEVWWARLPPPIGTRPVLLVSRGAAYLVRRSISIALITSTIRDIPVEVPLGPADGMPRRCVV